MNLPILIGTIAIELIIIVGVGWVLNLISKKKMDAAEFTTANRSMPAITVGATQALTCLGGGHIMGMVGAGWSYGVGTYWYALSSGFMLIIMLCFTGPWIRRFGFTTINQLFAKMFDHKTSVIMAGIAAGTVWGILTLELQGVGTVLGAITGWDIAFGCAVGGILSLLYVLFGGMKQVGWVNVINAIFMYVVAIIAIFMIGSNLPSGWEGVNNFFVSNSEDWKLSILANPNTWQTYIIGTILAQLFYCPIGPQAAQVSASAKNVDAIRKSVMIAVPINVVFGAIMLAFGMAAQSIPEYAAIGNPPLANFTNEIMAARFSEVMWLIEQIMWKSLDRRLAHFLLEESALEGTDALKITHETIGRHMGTAREVVTRMLRYFQGEGLVKLSRGTVELTGREQLESLAGG